jgi:hypothetical protein
VLGLPKVELILAKVILVDHSFAEAMAKLF